MDKKINMSAPWEIYFREIEALFRQDSEIHIKKKFTDDKKEIVLMIDNQDKADALERLLPKVIVFGNVTVQIEIKPSNFDDYDIVSMYMKAFWNNPVLEEVITADIPGSESTFLVFKNEVVRFFADNIRDYQGKKSTLYETIAEDVFGNKDGIFFCTAEEGKEWRF